MKRLNAYPRELLLHASSRRMPEPIGADGHSHSVDRHFDRWIPACAGMTLWGFK